MITNKQVVDVVNKAIEDGEIAQELPEIQSGDAGKVLQVNEQENGVEWATASSGGGNYFYGVDVANGSFIYITDNENISSSQDLVTDLINHGHTSSTTAWAASWVSFSGVWKPDVSGYGITLTHYRGVWGDGSSLKTLAESVDNMKAAEDGTVYVLGNPGSETAQTLYNPHITKLVF